MLLNLWTKISPRSGLKVLERVSRLCQLSSGWLSRRGSSCLGVSETRVQEDAVFWKPLRHVCQPHHPPFQHVACSPESSYLRSDEPGDVERADGQARPCGLHTVVARVQHAPGSPQELVQPHKDTPSAQRLSQLDPIFLCRFYQEMLLEHMWFLSHCNIQRLEFRGLYFTTWSQS